jgi:uncharacterized protein involved in exopolysaccharide biosynthesis
MLQTPETNEIQPAAFDEAALGAYRVFEPPSTFALAAIARHKGLVLACGLLLALLGVGLGLKRTPTFTASATLQVGQVNPNSPGFYGYTQSAASLATAFSRSISAEPVLAAIDRQLKVSPSRSLARLSSEPVPQTPAFRVVATGSNAQSAVQLANVAANAVIAYESESNSANPEAESLLHEYRTASLAVAHANAKVQRLSHKGRAASESALGRAEAERNTAGIRLRAIGNAYTGAVTSQAPRSGLVSLVSGAANATSDRKSKVELYGFIGLLLGIVLGGLVANAWSRLGLRRRLRREVERDISRSASSA